MAIAERAAAQPAPSPGAAKIASGAATARRRLLADRLATGIFTAGGLTIVASILGILVFIVVEVLPLVRPAQVTAAAPLPLVAAPAGLVVDEHRSTAVALLTDGSVTALSLADGQTRTIANLAAALAQTLPASPATATPPTVSGPPALPLRIAPIPASQSFAAATGDGRIALVPLAFTVSFDANQKRQVAPTVGTPVVLGLDPSGQPVGAFGARLDAEGGAVAAAQLASSRLAVVARRVEEDFAGNVSESLGRAEVDVPQRLTQVVIDAARRNLFAGTTTGELLWWELRDGTPANPQVVSAGTSAVSALTLLIGDRSVVVGQVDGSLSVWFPVRHELADGSEERRLTRVRDFPALPAAVAQITPSERDKGFLATATSGFLGLYHSTSHRTLWSGDSGVTAPIALAFSPKVDAAYVSGTSGGQPGLATLAIHNPHPETTFQTLFGKVWFEGYEEPRYVWQSTGGTDDFEPKLSLTPLLVGTLKGTFYSLLLAIPLGVFGAMYLSQLMHPTYKRYVKPAIEIMAALPSVILGFLAGLWLAPRIETIVPGIFAMLVVLPAIVLGTGWLWMALPRGFRGRIPTGTEAFLFCVTIALGIWACMAASPFLEQLLFGGSFRQWLLAATGLGYDQRNALVVGLAMGFAVIPIIFAISEDAFTNVPRNLTAGSLALGANRWQTVMRVVLPTASPGIFSAIMIGFGRAVGETMIVLMATGNTPIMDWNPFNGFRTLSANVAVEIPEAPMGGTLYRTLFLAALLLFLLTFVVNTVAELVRQRLRERYSRL
jgi:phosphate transport system permease protein